MYARYWAFVASVSPILYLPNSRSKSVGKALGFIQADIVRSPRISSVLGVPPSI